MENMNVSIADIAIVGLGEVGEKFLAELLERKARGLNVVCAAQTSDTPGKQLARDAGIPIVATDEIVAMGHKIDVIFDLTGNPQVRRELREQMQVTGNEHTIIATETVARMLWAVMTDEALGGGHAAAVGY